MRYFVFVLIFANSFISCTTEEKVNIEQKEQLEKSVEVQLPEITTPSIVVLGIAQDAGFPQAGCQKECCSNTKAALAQQKYITCLAIVDPTSKQRWIFEATPDFKHQLSLLNKIHPVQSSPGIDGIFLTHGHMGHYTGLMHLGREVMGTEAVKVFGMPRMREYLSNNGPWSQLVELNNIVLQPLTADSSVRLTTQIEVTPILVPHRDEFTETVGYRIKGPTKTILFIPDIDKWTKWERSIVDEIKQTDLVLIDGTFYANGEIKGRDMSEIPHPFIEESMELFDTNLTKTEKSRVHFIHFNHTNPMLNEQSEETGTVLEKGYKLTKMLDLIEL